MHISVTSDHTNYGQRPGTTELVEGLFDDHYRRLWACTRRPAGAVIVFLFLLDHYPDSFRLPLSNGMVVLEQYVCKRHINELQKAGLLA
jgi:hypothetical protein